MKSLNGWNLAKPLPGKVAKTVGKHGSVLGAFLIPLGIRTVPEIIAGPYPVGFDTINYYVPWSVHYPFNGTGFVAEPGFVFLVLSVLRTFTAIDPLLEMKIVFPIAYGILGVSLYLFSKHSLKWSGPHSLIVAVFVISQLSALRLSWDQLRILLGLSTTLLVVASRGRIARPGSQPKLLSSIDVTFKQDLGGLFLAVFAVLSNQLTALLAVPLCWKISLNQPGGHTLRRCIWLLPATILLALELYLYVMPTRTLTNDRVGWIATVNIGPRLVIENLLTNLAKPLTLFEFHIAPVIPFALVGNFRNSDLRSLLILASSGSIATAMLPSWPSSLYWIWLLVVGLLTAIYAGNGLWKISNWLGDRIVITRIGHTHRNLIRTLPILLVLFLALVYSSTDWVLPNPILNNYTPGGMLYSSVALSQTGNVEKAMSLVNARASQSSRIVVEETFKGWAELELRNDLQIWLVPGSTTLLEAYSQSVSSGVYPTLMVYSTSIPSGSASGTPAALHVLQSYGVVSVYEIRL